jgi:pyruvate dehydrogenase E2 component (dihydrolipoamide acetyltransferase)
MPIVITMPKLSDTMEEGGVAKWLKKEGEFVEEGEPLLEIETDKATMEYNSPEEGYLIKVVVPAGKTTPLNSPIAVFGKTKDEPVGDALANAGGGGHGAGQGKAVPPPPAAKAPAAATPAPAAKAQQTAAAQAASAAAVLDLHGSRLKASPLAKKIAKDGGLDLAAVHGTGPGGRIIQRDVAAALAQPAAQHGSASVAAAPMVAEQGDQVVPLTMMRKTIAKRLLAAKNDAPHFYLTRSINMTKTLRWRQELNSKQGVDVAKVSVNDIIILAVARALRRHPEINSSWQGDQLLVHSGVHVAVAVALPTGLVTPVLRHTDRLGVREIAKSSKELIEKAKGGSLKNEDYAGGTFTISNLGMLGIEEFTAIINPPQAAILAVGATIATPWVNDQQQVVVQDRMKVTMSCDHRVIDGAVGAQFLQTLTRFLEDPMEILV